MAEFFGTLQGRPYMIEGFVTRPRKRANRQPSDSPMQCYEGMLPTGEAMTETQLDMVWSTILELVGFDPKEARQVCGLTGHASRHFFPDLTMAHGWPIEDRNVLGRWAPTRPDDTSPPKKKGKSKKAAMANIYATGLASIEREFGLRESAIEIVRTFVGPRIWREVVPIQRKGPPSFSFFLLATGQGGAGELGQSEDEDCDLELENDESEDQ